MRPWKFSLLALAVGAVVSCATIYPAVHLWGIRGAAGVTSLSQFALLITGLICLQRARAHAPEHSVPAQGDPGDDHPHEPSDAPRTAAAGQVG